MLHTTWLKLILILTSISLLSACGGGGSDSSNNTSSPPSNVAPKADAGADRTADELTQVTLIGSGNDSDGSVSGYLWEQTSGTAVTLTNDDSANTSYLAPDVSADETLTFKLTVTDNDGASANDSVNILIVHNAPPIINIGDDQAIKELETITLSASVSDDSGDISTYLWQQLTGPEFELHSSNSATLVATAPLIAQEETATFRLTVTDNKGAQSLDEVKLTVTLDETGFIAFTPNLIIPDRVSSVRRDELLVKSFASSSNQVFKTKEPTLISVLDDSGTVFLGLANETGSLLNESGSNVNLGIESTAVTLVAVAAGYPISAIEPLTVDAIQASQQYQTLLNQLTTLLDIDNNFLDRLFDYPNIVTLIKQISAELPSPTDSSKLAMQQAMKQKERMRVQANDVTASTFKDDFYCSAFKWPCSDWQSHQPWHWYGQAKGAETLYPDNPIDTAKALAVGIFNPSIAAKMIAFDRYAEILSDASKPPFIARSAQDNNVHALANPSFANYAMEAYQDGEYKGWYYTPRNSTLIQKLLNSGAAQRRFTTTDSDLLNPNIDRVKFERYRFGWNGSDKGILPNRVALVSFMNTIGATFSAINIISDASEVIKFIHKLPLNDDETINNVVACSLTLTASMDFYYDNNVASVNDKLWSYVTNNAKTLFETLSSSDDCKQLATKGGKKFATILTKQSIKAAVDSATLATPVGWAKLAFDGVNDAIPVFTSYLAPEAAGVEYYLDWDVSGDHAFISNISSTKLPNADFTYQQQEGTTLLLDASNSSSDGSTNLTYQWHVDGAPLTETTSLVSYDFGHVGTHQVILQVTDDLGNTDNFTTSVTVRSGYPPEVNALTCYPTGNGKEVQMSVSINDQDDNISEIRWFDHPLSQIPIKSTAAGEPNSKVILNSAHDSAYGKVEVIDVEGNKESKICHVKYDLIADRYYDVGDGTVIDVTSDLQWMRCSYGQTWSNGTCLGRSSVRTWSSTKIAAESFTHNNNNDWRLPTQEELKSLTYCSTGNPAYWAEDNVCSNTSASPTIHPEAFPHVFHTNNFYYWSKTSANSILTSTLGTFIDFANGAKIKSQTDIAQTFSRFVRHPLTKSYQPLLIQKFHDGDIYSNDPNLDCPMISWGSDGYYACVAQVETGKAISLRASNNFNYWQIDCQGSSLNCNLTMDTSRHIQAIFKRPTAPLEKHQLNLTITGIGNVSSSPSGIDCSSDCSASFDAGPSVTLTATPNSGYVFAGWSGACSGSRATCSVSMNQSQSVTALFIDGEVRGKTLDVCDVWSASQSGGYGTTVEHWDISTIPSNATFDIKFDAYDVPDKFIVEYTNTTRLDTGWRGDSSYNSDPLYSGQVISPGNNQSDNVFTRSSADAFKVTVFGPDKDTSWDYQIRCRIN